jgi:hypothetical protein
MASPPPRSGSTVRLVLEAPALKSAAQGGPHPLVVSWLERADAAAVRESGTIPTAAILRFVERAAVHDLAAGADSVVVDTRHGLVPIAVLDVDRTFWPTVLADGGSGLVGAAEGPADGPSVAVPLRRPSGATDGQPSDGLAMAADHHVVTDPVSGLSRRIAVRPLDGGSDRAGEGFRTIYLLPGLGGTDIGRLQDREFVEGCRRLAVGDAARWLLVSVDTSDDDGTHYLSDRSAQDGWLSLLTERLVGVVEREYRTIADPRARILAGHSAGALNAIQVAMRAPGVFATVLASAPDPLDLGYWLLGPDGTVLPHWRAWMRLEQRLGGGGQMLSYARSWSPGPGASPRWPCDLDSGRSDQAVLAEWLAASPSEMLKRAPVRTALQRLQGRLVIGVARNDEFDLAAPALRFAEQLDGWNIGHRLILDDAGHFDGSRRLVRLLEASAALDLVREALR